MDRCHIVVCNFSKIAMFWGSFNRLQKFDRSADRIIIFDCSPETNREIEMNITRQAVQYHRLQGCVFWVRRGNWLMNHGAQLDYIDLLRKGVIKTPKLVYFMQEHYLNITQEVSSDTIPAHLKLDIDDFEKVSLLSEVCYFCARQGYRVTRFFGEEQYSVPLDILYRNRGGEHHRNEGIDFSLCIDGANFGVNPKVLIDALAETDYKTGPGTYRQTHCWETYLVYLIEKRGFGFYDRAQRSLIYRPKELQEANSINWQPFWADPIAWRLYGIPDLGNPYSEFPISLAQSLFHSEHLLQRRSLGYRGVLSVELI